jgi:hypothetical protein
VTGLVEGSVGSGGQEHLRFLDVGPVGPGPVAGGLDRQDDALGAAGGEVAGHLLVAVEMGGGHGDHLVLQAQHAGVDGEVQGVLGEEAGVDRLGNLVGLLARVVDIPPHPPGLAVLVLLPVGLQGFQDGFL